MTNLLSIPDRNSKTRVGRVTFPTRLAEYLKDALAPKVGTSLTTQRVADLRTRLRRGQAPDYNEDWAAFAYLYYAANFAKAYLAASRLFMAPHWLPDPIRLIDLGCGGGSSAAGVLAAAAQYNVAIQSIHAIDASQAQLSLFACAAQNWIRDAEPGIECTWQLQDVFTFLLGDPDHYGNFLVASYMRGELSVDQQSTFDKLVRRFMRQNNGRVLIIDRIGRAAGTILDTFDDARVLLPTGAIALDLTFLDDFGLRIPPKYARAHIRRDHLPQILISYFDAWQHHDVAMVQKIFAPNASYVIDNHFTFRGIAEIVTYWLKNSREQTHVRWLVSRCEQTRGGISAVWQAEFDRIDRELHYVVEGDLQLTVREGQIIQLSERYHVTLEPVLHELDCRRLF